MNIGIIGFGNMGSMIANGIMESNIVTESDVAISTRTIGKADTFRKTYPRCIIGNNIDVAKRSDLLFICVKPAEVKTVAEEIQNAVNRNCHLVSLAGSVRIELIESILGGKITKVIPTAVSEAGHGYSLTIHNKNVTAEDKKLLYTLLLKLGKVQETDEENYGAIADMTSCGPGLIAGIFEEFVAAGVRNSSLSEDDVRLIITETLYGTAKMVYEKNIRFNTMIGKVATKGGITEEGLSVIRSTMPGVFDEIFRRTSEKRDRIREQVEKIFL